MSSIAWMMIVWSFVGDVSSCAAYDLAELLLSVGLENWKLDWKTPVLRGPRRLVLVSRCIHSCGIPLC